MYGKATSGEQLKSHTDYRINEQRAEVLRKIFRMYAPGHGHVTIPKTLNGERRRQNFVVEDPADADLKRLRVALRGRLAQFDRLMMSDIPIARQAFRKLLVGRIAFQAEVRDGARAYKLNWAIVTKPLLEPSGYIGMASPRGFEPLYSP